MTWVALLLAMFACTSGFHGPSHATFRSARSIARRTSSRSKIFTLGWGSDHFRPSSIVRLYFGKENEDKKSTSVPFFARALDKLRRKKNDRVCDHNKVLTSTWNSTNPDIKNASSELKTLGPVEKGKKLESDALSLRALAVKSRLEAEKLDLKLTLAKIEKLEKSILQINKNPDLSSNLIDETQILLQKLHLPKSTSYAANLPPAKQRSEGVPQPSHVSDFAAISDNQIEKSTTMTIEKVPITADKCDDAVDGFERLPKQIKDMMAKTVGLKDGNNATAVIEKLMQENRLFEGDGEDKFSMTTKVEDIEDIITDLEFAEITTFVKSLLPESTRKDPLNEEYADAFYTEVLGLDTFNPFSKPENVPGGFIIRGESKVRPKGGKDEGDLLIEALDKKLAGSSVDGKVSVYYILDPTPPTVSFAIETI
ncbi:hypothetical protein ACHAXS_001719 [Conticribra weissflogii]